MSREVTITVTMSAAVAEQLAQFAKRLTLEDFLNKTETRLSKEDREEDAYQMQSGIYAITVSLAEAGFNPR